MSEKIPLDIKTFETLRPAKVFTQQTRKKDSFVKSMTFQSSGEFLAISKDDDCIYLYDCQQGKSVLESCNAKYGVDAVRFTHKDNCLLFSSFGTKEPIIRYLSTHDNQFLRYFKGHESRISSFEMSPLDDTFISGSDNDTVRLWDLRRQSSIGVLKIGGKPLVAYDPQGIIFVVALNSRYIRLFDVKNYDKGPFSIFEVDSKSEWVSISFSFDGKDILISTKGDEILLVDSFDGSIKMKYENKNNLRLSLQASMTPDSKFVLCGSQDGNINVWIKETGTSIASLESHLRPCSFVEFNPCYAMMASSCNNLVFWLPDLKELWEDA